LNGRKRRNSAIFLSPNRAISVNASLPASSESAQHRQKAEQQDFVERINHLSGLSGKSGLSGQKIEAYNFPTLSA
jgi:hypothetical protein